MLALLQTSCPKVVTDFLQQSLEVCIVAAMLVDRSDSVEDGCMVSATEIAANFFKGVAS